MEALLVAMPDEDGFGTITLEKAYPRRKSLSHHVSVRPHAANVIVPTHLHVHSHFTLLGATPAVEELARRAAADGFRHLALTDANALYGAVRFVRACEAAGVQPIVGMTVHLAPPPDFPDAEMLSPGVIALLAAGPKGYHSLSHLSSRIQRHPDREERERRGLTLDDLAGYSEGVIGIFGGRRSWLERLWRRGRHRLATRRLARLAGIFDENGYLALEWHEDEDSPVLNEMSDLAGRFGVPTVIAHPVYILTPHHRPRLRLLAAIDHNCRLEEVPAWALVDDGKEDVALHWLSPAALRRRYAAWPEALERSDAIAAQCQPALPDGRPIWPALPATIDSSQRNSDEILADLARAGLMRRYGEDADASIHQRLDRELAAIARHGYAPLFLVVADIVRHAREQRIAVSTRGSVANSLAAFAIGITTVDPIAHDLLFERFLNPAREDHPDIDLDFDSRRRDEALDYVRRAYGDERVALVCTVSLMRPRSAFRETAKALGLNDTVREQVIRLLPRSFHPGMRRKRRTLAEIADSPEIAALPDRERVQMALRLAHEIVGLPHHLSVHPGGTVITPTPLPDYAPVQWSSKNFLILQYDHQDAERIGLTKIDLLGVRALSVLDAAERLVHQHYAPGFRLEAIPPDDPKTGDIISRGETVGVFQCESAGAQRTLRKLRARNVADLAIANALFKPGPATGGMAATFVRRYRGEERVRYLHPALEPILGRTKGVLIYQEQILRVATEIAGLSWADANHLRRGMSKFKPQEMMALQETFIQGCMRLPPRGPGFDRRQAETLWEQVRAFAGYGFNQGHATAYADVSYRSAYVKANWPAAFMAARLAERGGFHHPAVYMAEARRLGMVVRQPHVNHSEQRFSLAFEAGRPILWMGLAAVRGLRRAAIAAIISHRPYASLRDLLLRVRLQRREAENLIRCGALDGLGESRNALLAQLPQGKATAMQLSFDFFTPEIEPETPSQRLAWETRILGMPMSQHPLTSIRASLPPGLARLDEFRDRPGQRLRAAAVRLPGWTGEDGYFLADETDYLLAIPENADASPPPLWEPIIITGRWLTDDWGRAWLALTTFTRHAPIAANSHENILS